MSNKIPCIEIDGKLTTHMGSADGDYATLCGLDGDDQNWHVNQIPVETPIGAKINCVQCWDIFNTARKYKYSDFDVGSDL